MSSFKVALPPTVSPKTRVLILGSLPGERSLAAQEYYAHPTNAFWWLMGEILLEPGLPAMPYPERLALLSGRGVGLWDVLAGAHREGSLDAAIKNAVPRDLPDFVERLPHLRAIGFNGAAAAKQGRSQLGMHADRWALLDLPSSSAAHAAMTRTGKLQLWRSMADYLA